MKKEKIWSTNKIVSSSAMLVSTLTLIVFIYQTTLMRQQQQLSVMPYLSISNNGTNTPNFKVILKNDGIGPAFIESRTITYQDSVYDMDLPNFLRYNIPAYDSIRHHVYYSNITPGRMIPHGEIIYLFQVDNSLEVAKKLDSLLVNLPYDIQITYSSIYKQRWQIKNNQPIPKRIR
ncbi:MAG: hypothetical protein Sapg2KO_35760 [Saprospiraceae bacterium]